MLTLPFLQAYYGDDYQNQTETNTTPVETTMGLSSCAATASGYSLRFVTLALSTLACIVLLGRAHASPHNLASGPFEASTTEISFGVQTACGCTTPMALLSNLTTIGWYGAATPAWLGAPYLGSPDADYNCGACPGKTCNAGLVAARVPFHECANGAGGCGKCLELTVLDETNIHGAKGVPPGTTIRVVVMDNCEMNNQHSDNEQWCVPFTDMPAGGCAMDPPPSCESPHCASGTPLTQAGGKWHGGAWDLTAQCGALDAFTCTNCAGKPTHVDVVSPPWPSGSDPVVSVAYVACPDAVVRLIQASCKNQQGASCALP